MSRRDDPYGALGVDATATTDEIQIAFRQLIRSLHPTTASALPPTTSPSTVSSTHGAP